VTFGSLSLGFWVLWDRPSRPDRAPSACASERPGLVPLRGLRAPLWLVPVPMVGAADAAGILTSSLPILTFASRTWLIARMVVRRAGRKARPSRPLTLRLALALARSASARGLPKVRRLK
jgi:hypothetical protein